MGKVLIVRYHGEFLVALQVSQDLGKLSVLILGGKLVNVNPQQVVYVTDLYLPSNKFDDWRICCDKLSESINLHEVWEVLQGEVPFITVQQICALVFGGLGDAALSTSLILMLFRANPYFVMIEGNCVPNSAETVKAFLAKEEQLRERNVERQVLISWLKKESKDVMLSNRQKEWINHLRMYAIFGEKYSSKQMAKGLLADIGLQVGDLQSQVFELLVGVGIFHQDEPLNLYRQRISLEFPLAVVERAKSLSLIKHKLEGYSKEFLDPTTISIDEKTTKDVDDALSLQETDQGFVLGIHITDATILVPFDDVVDKEASKRLSTIYFPEITFPMLPKSLSEEAGSLLTGVKRPVLSVIVHLDYSLRIISWDIRSSVIKNSASFSYKEVDLILTGQPSSFAMMLRSLQMIAKEFHNQRISQGSLELLRPELKIQFDQSGVVEIEVFEKPSPARKLVSEFMILANHLMAEFCKDNKIPAIYRSQEKLMTEDLAGLKEGPVLAYLLMRRLRPSSIGLKPLPHALLGVPVYIQATSPLRRYSDLIMQRQLRSFMESGESFYSRDSLQAFIYDAELQIREIGRLEENRKRHWLLRYLSTRIGSIFMGIVLEIRNNRALFEIDKLALRTDCFVNHPLNLGDKVDLELLEVDLWKGEARFSLVFPS